MENELIGYLKHLGIPVSVQFIRRFILSHPDYPALVCISDLLTHLQLQHNISRISLHELDEITPAYLVIPEHSGIDLTAIKNKNELENLKKKVRLGSLILIQVEPVKKVKNVQYQKSFQNEETKKWVGRIVVLVLAFLFFISVTYSSSWYHLVWSISSFVGLILGYLLYLKDLGIKYDAVEKFCNSGNVANCDKVLESDHSKVFSFLKLPDLVLSFFLFQLFVLFNSTVSNFVSDQIWPLFMVLSMLTIPIIVYSLYLQYSVLKSWCRLCLLVSVVLVLQFILTLDNWFIGIPDVWSMGFWVSLAIISIFPVILGVSYLVRVRIEESKEIFQIAVKASRVKYSPDVFRHLLMHQKEVNANALENELVIGNPKALVKIIFISNLYCSPCKVRHEEVSRLIELYPEDLAVTFRFVKVRKYYKDTISSNQYLFQYWWENIAGKADQYLMTNVLLHEWYEVMDIGSFSHSHQIKGTIAGEVYKLEEEQDAWIEIAQVERTPTIYINGYELPSLYELADLKLLLRDLPDLQLTAQNESQVLN